MDQYGLTCSACATLKNISRTELSAYLGRSTDAICDTQFHDASLNHCAHFVSHVLGIKLGMLCGNMVWANRGKGVSIRVDEVYNRCTLTGAWADRPRLPEAFLAFVTPATNMNNSRMGQSPKKHVGICIAEEIWHYSNTQDKVVLDSPDSFLAKFKSAYGANTQLLFGVM